MSLFGNIGQNPAAPTSNAGGGLFGNLGGASTNTTTTGGSNLFGNLTSNSQAQQKPSLFGTASNTPATGSLFGGLGSSTATSQPQASTGGLFSNLGAAPKPAASGGLFGNLSTSGQTTQPAATSLFGTTNVQNAAAQPPASGSLFGGLGQSQQSLATQTQSHGPGQPRPNVAMSQSAYFDQLLEKGRKRNSQENGSVGDLPSLQLGLGDIARKVRNLGNGGPTAQASRPSDSKAHYLLAASGVSTASALRDLNNFSAQAGTVVPPAAVNAADNDLESYLADMNSRTTMELIQEGFEQSKRDFDTFLEENVQMNWEAQRRKIYEHFGLVRPLESAGDADNNRTGVGEKGAFGRSSRRTRAMGTTLSASGGISFGASFANKSILGSSSMRNSLKVGGFGENGDKNAASNLQTSAEDRHQRDKQEKYAEKVKALNVARNQEAAYPLLHNFTAVEQQVGIDTTAALTNAYSALIQIVGEPGEQLRKNEKGAIKERQYRDAYLTESKAAATGDTLALRQRIIDGSRQCLEELFWKKLQNSIEKEPNIASLGGVPLPINKVRGFIRVLAYRKDLTPDLDRLERANAAETEQPDYTWALLYYLLRCGLVAEAAQYVRSNAKAFSSKNFARAIEAYSKSAERRIPGDVRNLLNTDYTGFRHVESESSKDPFKVACYKIVGRCDLGRRTLDSVKMDEEDWLWLQFALARETSRVEESAGEAFGLEQLQTVVRDIGQRHFVQNSDNASGYGTFFFMQILAGMFEQAIAWLYPRNHVSAVHFAIALDYYGLLRVSDLTASELLTFTTAQKPRLHFPLMIGYYTADFRSAKPQTAVDYLVLLCLNADLEGEAGRRQAEICYEALRELVLETREFAQLLGDVRSDGQRVPGSIQQRLKLIRSSDAQSLQDNETFLKTLTIQAASAADDSGRTTDAVLLYHLAEEYDTVLRIVNRAVSTSLSVELGAEPLRLEPLKARSQDQQQSSSASSSSTALVAQQQRQDDSTLSLTAVSDPLVLAANMSHLYSEGSIAYRTIRRETRDATSILRRLGLAKQRLESGAFLPCLETIEKLNLLPLTAAGNISAIRASALNFDSWPDPLPRNVGDVLMWAVICCGRERERLQESEFVDEGRKQHAAALLQAARDMMVFAGLIRYKVPGKVYEALASVGEGFGA